MCKGHLQNLKSIYPLLLLLGVCLYVQAESPDELKTEPMEPPITHAQFETLIDRHCTHCHDAADMKGQLDLDSVLFEDLAGHTAVWEKVIRKIDARQMPPMDKKRPTEREYLQLTQYLETALQTAFDANPNPGRTETFRRLSRTEYQNAIRDLLSLNIDATELLPADESSHGFDHITVSNLSPALLSRYIQAAQKVSRLAVGRPLTRPGGKTYRIPPDVTQEKRMPGLPLGTRGGTLLKHHFPESGVYEVQIRLARDRNEHVEGLRGSHQLEILLDRERMAEFKVAPPEDYVANHFDDSKLKARIQVTAGPHDLGVTFVKNDGSIEETRRKPLNVHFNAHRHPRLSPAIYQISITGPFKKDQAPAKIIDTPSREKIFVARPSDSISAEVAAREIFSNLARRAYRRSITEDDIKTPMEFFNEAYAEHGFDAGIERGLTRLLCSPHFLFKIERDPEKVKPGANYQISEFELASRLSFFVWSSIPDDELLLAAESGTLRDPKVLEKQVRRMLADPKAKSLATNFASQWLHLRNLDSITPDGRLYPDFDDNLRQAMRRETELHFEHMVKSDRSVLELIQADHTYLNERLAKHYEVPHVYGNRFRRVSLNGEQKHQRGGLLRQASILTVTSYATRTSPVIRGNWVLENILGAPAPPPPQDVPSLDEGVISSGLSMRERLAKHREDPACASCHNLMDPVGFSLEQFDAVGRFRLLDQGRPIDVSGGLPDGSEFEGISGLEQNLLKRPELFVMTLTEKLLVFGLGRGLEHYDGPVVRRIVRQAKDTDYQFSSLVLGIVRSQPFQMRKAK